MYIALQSYVAAMTRTVVLVTSVSKTIQTGYLSPPSLHLVSSLQWNPAASDWIDGAPVPVPSSEILRLQPSGMKPFGEVTRHTEERRKTENCCCADLVKCQKWGTSFTKTVSPTLGPYNG